MKWLLLNGILNVIFKCNYRNKISEFDGVSIIKFDEANKIISVKEFQSDSRHVYPYENKTSAFV